MGEEIAVSLCQIFTCFRLSMHSLHAPVLFSLAHTLEHLAGLSRVVAGVKKETLRVHGRTMIKINRHNRVPRGIRDVSPVINLTECLSRGRVISAARSYFPELKFARDFSPASTSRAA